MKAVVIEKFGGTDELKVAEVTTPVPGNTEILIEVDHAAVNPVDWKIREGKLAGALPHDFPIILGWDAAGTVKAKGSAVKVFQEGDRVFVYCRKPVVKMGSYAEYLTVDSSAAATVPLVGLTAWQALFEVASLEAGETVLVTAASGGVGGYAVQFAKHAGARVYGTCSTKNLGYVRELGAEAIDYTDGPFARSLREREPEGVDVVFDCVGGDTLKASYDLVKRGGRLVTIVDTPDADAAAARGIRAAYHFVYPNGTQLTRIGGLIGEGKVKVLPFDTLPLSRVGEAHGLSEGRHQRGKIALKVKGGL